MTEAATIRIYLVDDHAILRMALREKLEREADLTVCGEAISAEEALGEVTAVEPDLVLIDVSLPGMSGIELARRLRKQHPELPLAMLSGHRERSHVEQALAAGAQGYIVKGRSQELPGAVRQLAQGERYVSPMLS